MRTKDIYLDYNATTPVDEAVLSAMQPFFCSKFGNPSSSHRYGQAAAAAVERARIQVAALISAKPDEIVFTGGATEGNNQIIASQAKKGMIITSAAEHSSVYEPCRHWAENGANVEFLPVTPRGYPEPDVLETTVSGNVSLVSLIMANNETGILLQNIPVLAEIAHRAGALFHLDATQAVGKIPVNVSITGVDLLTFSAHKIYGPKGIGALYTRRGCQLEPLLFGGGQENNRRPGTQNIPAIAGFGEAAKIAVGRLESDAVHSSLCRDHFESRLLAETPEVKIHGNNTPRLPGTSSVAMPGSDAEKLAIKLDQAGIAVSAGAACSNGTSGASRVLTAMNIPMLEAAGTLRFSFGRMTTIEDVDYVCTTLIRQLKIERAFNKTSGVISV
jgi:cysteine desulfurase